MRSQDIREAFLKHQQNQGHVEIARANLVPNKDESTLFTGSGMQAILPYLLGESHPDGERLSNSQPCLRSQDIEEVGDNRHTTFFEMLGNWSLGDYFKEQQIRSFFTFLVDDVGIDPTKIYVTCFMGDEEHGLPRDTEAAEIWQRVFTEYGIQADVATIGSQANGNSRGINPGERIFFYDSDENWWSRGGSLLGTPFGDPCGPDSEVFYDFGPDSHDETYGKAHPASDSGQFMEIGNQVFMQYRRELDGTFSQLEKRNVDFGGGLERITAASLNNPDVYVGSLLWPIVELLSDLSNSPYESHRTSLRIIADHLRGAVFLTADGVVPSNKEQGYVLRRLLRRSITTARAMGFTDSFFEPVVKLISDLYESDYPEIRLNREKILGILTKEETVFRRTLDAGIRVLERHDGVLTGKDIFKLSDTKGFPKELSIEEAHRLGLSIDPQWEIVYAAELDEQKSRSRAKQRSAQQ